MLSPATIWNSSIQFYGNILTMRYYSVYIPRMVVTENPTTGGNSQKIAVQRQWSVVISYSHTLFFLCCKLLYRLTAMPVSTQSLLYLTSTVRHLPPLCEHIHNWCE